MPEDEPLLSPSRLHRAIAFWVYFLIAGLDLGFWSTLRFYRRETARVAYEGEDYPPTKLVWPNEPRNLH